MRGVVMVGYFQFAEDYFELLVDICAELRTKEPSLRFRGISIRRKTVCKKVDGVSERLGIDSCEWWNDVEERIFSTKYHPDKLNHYQSIFGTRKLRKLISSGRELGHGLLGGGVYAKTTFRKRVEQDDETLWKYVVGILDYFFKEFDVCQPDFVFLNEITHPWELAMYYVANKLNIPCFALVYMRSGGGYSVLNNPFERSLRIEECYRNALVNPAEVSDHLEDARKSLSSFREASVLPVYSVENRKKVQRQASIPGMLCQVAVDLAKVACIQLGIRGTSGFLRQRSGFDLLKTNLKTFKSARAVLSKETIFELADSFVGDPYLFYPLHVEPEATTMVLSERFSNQLAFIELLAKNMPMGFRLLVKEHQPMIGKRPSWFYERIRGFPNTHLISPFADSYQLIKSSRLVCVLSGTAGWEAMMLGRPVLIVGDSQYQGIGEGFIRCLDLLNLDQEIEQALDLKPVDTKKLEAFIAATMTCQVPLTARSVAYRHYGLAYSDVRLSDGAACVATQILDGCNL